MNRCSATGKSLLPDRSMISVKASIAWGHFLSAATRFGPIQRPVDALVGPIPPGPSAKARNDRLLGKGPEQLTID